MKRLLLSILLSASLFGMAFVIAPAAHAMPSADIGCQITYTVTASFNNGFLAEVYIANTGSTTINSWTLQFTFSGNQQITSSFNGGFTQSGQNVTVVSRSWNGTIPSGQTLGLRSPGFEGAYSGTNTNPTSFTINGTRCSVG